MFGTSSGKIDSCYISYTAASTTQSCTPENWSLIGHREWHPNTTLGMVTIEEEIPRLREQFQEECTIK